MFHGKYLLRKSLFLAVLNRLVSGALFIVTANLLAGKKSAFIALMFAGAFGKLSAARLLENRISLGHHCDLFGTVQSWLRDRKVLVVVAFDRSSG